MEHVRIFLLWMAVLFLPGGSLFANEDFRIGSPGRPDKFLLFEENGKVGLKDEDGKVLIPAQYDAIGWGNGKLSIIDKVVGYQSDGMWGLIHTSNKVLTPAEFLDIKPGEGSLLIGQKRSALSQRPSFGVISTSGKTIIPFIYDGLKLSGMRAIVMSRSGNRFHFGLTDLSHKSLIPLEYQRIYSLGSLRYAVENFDDKTAIFSEEGNQLTAFSIDSISPFRNDLAIIYENQRQGVINRDGQVVVKTLYDEVQLPDDGTIRIRDTDVWYFLTGDNEAQGEFRGDALTPVSPQRYLVSVNGKLQLTDNNFKPLHEGVFSSLGQFQQGRAVFTQEQKSGVITTNGEILIPAKYHRLEMDDKFFRACLDGSPRHRWIMLDLQGKQITEKHYEYIGAFNGKYYPVKNRGFWGALDENGKEIITCVHDSLIQHSTNNIAVKFKGQYGVINLRENWLVTPGDNRIEVLNDQVYFEYDHGTTFLKAVGGGIIYFSDNVLTYADGFITEHLPTGAHWTIDMSGIIVDRSNQPLTTEKIFPESEGLRAILKDGKYGFIDNAGRLRIANRYEEVKPFSDGRAAIRIKGRWGFIDHQENLVVQPVYDEVENFSNGMAIVKRAGLYGVIDRGGKVVLPVRYDAIALNAFNRFILRQGQLYGMADETGRIIINPRYEKITDPGNGYIIVARDRKLGAVTLNGVSTIPMIYDELTFDSHHNHFLAQKRSAWQTLPQLKSAAD
jgi:hypothetical protein